MAIAAALVGARGTSAGSSVTTTAGSTTGGSGNHGVLCLSWDATRTVTTPVTDSKGNTFTAIGTAQADGNGGLLQFWVSYNWTGGATHSITVNFSGAAFPVAHLIEVTGGSSSPQDQANQTTDASSPYTITTGTLAQAAECVLSACGANTGSDGAYSSSTDTVLSQEPSVASFWTSGVGYVITASTSAVTPSWTVWSRSGGASVIYLALKEGTAGPTISAQPQSTTVYQGQTANFTVTASGTGTLHYQWKDDGSNVGTDSSSYTTAATVLGDNGAQITVDVTDDNGTTSSSAATLTVIPTGIVGWTRA